NAVTNTQPLELAALFATYPVVLVKLGLRNAAGELISENFYWGGRDEAALRALNELPKGMAQMTASSRRDGDEIEVRAALHNTSTTSVLANKLTLLDDKDARILPAYYSDNYVSLLPGEQREITFRYPATRANAKAKIALRAWNARPATTNVRSHCTTTTAAPPSTTSITYVTSITRLLGTAPPRTLHPFRAIECCIQ